MIRSLDLVKWLADTLRDPENLTLYTCEYATALLMNLVLRRAGKLRCERDDVDIVGVLNELLEHDGIQVRNYVNGALFSVLARPRIRERARALGMEQILGTLIEHSDEALRHQLQYIVGQLQSDQADDEESDEEDENDPDEDADDDEEDEDEDAGAAQDGEREGDLAVPGASGLSGERLLCTLFLAGEAGAREQSDAHELSMSQRPKTPGSVRFSAEDNGKPIGRPITPRAYPAPREELVERRIDSAEDDPDAELKIKRDKIPRTPHGLAGGASSGSASSIAGALHSGSSAPASTASARAAADRRAVSRPAVPQQSVPRSSMPSGASGGSGGSHTNLNSHANANATRPAQRPDQGSPKRAGSGGKGRSPVPQAPSSSGGKKEGGGRKTPPPPIPPDQDNPFATRPKLPRTPGGFD